MAEDEYTPEMDLIRHAYATWAHGDYAQRSADFDRALAAHDAETLRAERARIAADIEARETALMESPDLDHHHDAIVGRVNGLRDARRIALGE